VLILSVRGPVHHVYGANPIDLTELVVAIPIRTTVERRAHDTAISLHPAWSADDVSACMPATCHATLGAVSTKLLCIVGFTKANFGSASGVLVGVGACIGIRAGPATPLGKGIHRGSWPMIHHWSHVSGRVLTDLSSICAYNILRRCRGPAHDLIPLVRIMPRILIPRRNTPRGIDPLNGKALRHHIWSGLSSNIPSSIVLQRCTIRTFLPSICIATVLPIEEHVPCVPPVEGHSC